MQIIDKFLRKFKRHKTHNVVGSQNKAKSCMTYFGFPRNSIFIQKYKFDSQFSPCKLLRIQNANAVRHDNFIEHRSVRLNWHANTRPKPS